MTLREYIEWLEDWGDHLDAMEYEIAVKDPMPFGAKNEELTIASCVAMGNKVVIENNCKVENTNQKDMFS